MAVMYDGVVNSPEMSLVNSIDSTQTTIELDDVSKLLPAPNLLTIGYSGENPETIKYTEVSGTVLTVEREFEGTAQPWDAQESVARVFTAYDHNGFKTNIESLQN